jgi:hypothetical protein
MAPVQILAGAIPAAAMALVGWRVGLDRAAVGASLSYSTEA